MGQLLPISGCHQYFEILPGLALLVLPADPIISDDHLSKIMNVNKNLEEKSWYSEEMKYVGYQWDEIYSDASFYKRGHAGQGLYISTSRDLVIAFYGTYNTDLQEHQLPFICRQLSKSELFE